ncbi:MAG: hypothetical protein N3I86_10990 [Verrucomicrobiae bacterium]|nr:hypothetical protein [Verrucomicrobiae bacterium]
MLLSAALVRGGTPDPLLQPPGGVARSASGQFIAYGVANRDTPLARQLAGEENFLPLEPALVVVACERIKQALATALHDRTPWQGKIFLVAHPARTAEEAVTLVAERIRGGWQYRLELPDPIERTRLARALVHALLRERAGRGAREHAPDVPAWLAEGLTEHLMQTRGMELLPPAPRWQVGGLTLTPLNVSGRWRDPLDEARRRLREQPPSTFEELSWPGSEQLEGPDAAAFRANAQVFVTELLRLPEGPARLNAMLDQLAVCYNWQTAFFRAFDPLFQRPIDVEKWWALQITHYTGRDLTRTWSLPVSWARLEEALRVPVEVRRRREELPVAATVPLSTVLREWPFARQETALRERLRALDLLRLRVAQELVGLVDEYRRLLALYLDRRARLGLDAPGVTRPSLDARLLVRETLQRLDELEAMRERLRPLPEGRAGTNAPPAEASPR